MSWIKELLRDRDERHQLIQLGHEIEKNAQDFRESSAGLKRNSNEYHELISELDNERRLLDAEIAEIETERMLRKAHFWRVPVPRYPMDDSEQDDNWRWHSVYGRYFLSVKALRDLRREIYQEREMWTRPYLSWTALVISVISLLTAFLTS